MRWSSLVLVMLAACDTTRELTHKYDLPPELKDCKVYCLVSEGERTLYVVRCPGSLSSAAVTENCGKNCTRHITTIANP